MFANLLGTCKEMVTMVPYTAAVAYSQSLPNHIKIHVMGPECDLKST